MALESNVYPTPQRPGHRTVRAAGIAVRVNIRALKLAAIAAVTLAVLVVWAVTLGSFTIPFQDVILAIFGRGTEDTEMVVRSLRLPRILSAVMVGAALAISGTIFQGIARNPLVSPDIIGINTGATLFAMAAIIFGVGSALVPAAAFTGALITAVAIYALSWKNGISTNRLILVGIGVGAVVSAGSTYLTVKFPVEIIRPAVVWSMGSFYATTWDDVILLAVSLVVLIPLSIILMESLRTLQFGDVMTRSLGVPLERTRLLLMVVGCALAAISVSLAGPIGFVALIVPHMGRMIAGPATGSVLVFTSLLGSIMLLGSDIVAQHMLPVTLPVGVITGAVGAPYFLYLLYRSNQRA
ncbi:MAG TPA: iron chelate uptake ABC transporter family permease subunit [Thermomicrobiales bacterium]|nr:iron chelate uptake ABC transporter family permease subunit [Thermomicrobiales bacterium]